MHLLGLQNTLSESVHRIDVTMVRNQTFNMSLKRDADVEHQVKQYAYRRVAASRARGLLDREVFRCWADNAKIVDTASLEAVGGDAVYCV